MSSYPITSQLWIKLSVVVDKTCYHNNVSLHPVCTSKLLGKQNKIQRTLLALMSILFRERIHNCSSKSPFDCMLFLFTLQCDPMWLWGNSGNSSTYMLEFVVMQVTKVNYEKGYCLVLLLSICTCACNWYFPVWYGQLCRPSDVMRWYKCTQSTSNHIWLHKSWKIA